MSNTSLPWWRYRMVWLVIGGPAVVVVACIATLVIAVTYPDPVLPTVQTPALKARNLGASK
jgi:uncharacterized protein